MTPLHSDARPGHTMAGASRLSGSSGLSGGYRAWAMDVGNIDEREAFTTPDVAR
jgi:hypothetical protein